MEYFCHTVQGTELHLYPLVCWHLGAKQSDETFIGKIIDTIQRDPLAKAFYLGDGGECNIKESKGDLYSQTMNPGEQLEACVQKLSQIQDKLLFGVKGNHGNRIYKATGMSWDKELCARVGIPYLGTSAIGDIFFDPRARGMADTSISFYCHHGSANGITAGGKTQGAKKAELYTQTDLSITAHSHACGELICPRHYVTTNPRNRKPEWHTTRSFLAGSAYDSRTGYAEDMQYPPILPEHLMIKLKYVRTNDQRQIEISGHKITTFPGDTLSEAA